MTSGTPQAPVEHVGTLPRRPGVTVVPCWTPAKMHITRRATRILPTTREAPLVHPDIEKGVSKVSVQSLKFWIFP